MKLMIAAVALLALSGSVDAKKNNKGRKGARGEGGVGRFDKDAGNFGGKFSEFFGNKLDGEFGGNKFGGKFERIIHGRGRMISSFNTWCSESWSQKRSCVEAMNTVRLAADAIQESAYSDETTGLYTADIHTVLSAVGSGVLATNITGYVEYDGVASGLTDIKEEDPEFFQSIRRPGFSYLLEDDGEQLTFNALVKVQPPKEIDEVGDELEGEDDFTTMENFAPLEGELFEGKSRPQVVRLSVPVVISESK